MAIFRKIHTQFWSDPFVQTLSPEKKYFYLYILTNEKTRQCGIYEITTRQISFDTGYTIDTVLILIEYFISMGKILFSRETNEIAVKNWKKYNDSRSPGVQKCINEELTKVKNVKLVEWVQNGSIVGTRSLQEEPEEEEEKEPEGDAKSKFFKPKPDYEIELPEIDLNRAVEFVTRTKYVQVSKELILAIWGTFKSKHFTGKKGYKDNRDIIRHFFESLKFQQIDGKHNTGSVGKTLEFDPI